MRKISTLFKKDPNNLGLVINEIDPENAWALTEGRATRKFDGTACMITHDGRLYKRYDAKRGKTPPANGIPCQEPDLITGHWPHWVEVDGDKPEDKYFIEGLVNYREQFKCYPPPGTYELCGPKIQGNPEKIDTHWFYQHGRHWISLGEITFESIKEYLTDADIEGIVFHHPDGRMCKIRKCDFGIKR